MKNFVFYCTFPLLLCLLLAKNIALAQNSIFLTSSGNTKFSASTPLEDIEAENRKSQAVLNTASGEIAIRMNIKDFIFPNKLMQEHFNENYMDSDKYSTATFSGKINTLPDLSKDGEHNVSAVGKLTVHGVPKDRTIPGKISVMDGKMTIISDFQISLSDHKIEVPKVVFVKIAQVISVRAQYVLIQKK